MHLRTGTGAGSRGSGPARRDVPGCSGPGWDGRHRRRRDRLPVEYDITTGQLQIGQLVAERYVVEELIGRGGMAEVYRARDERLARPVALKVLRGHYARDPGLRTRFEEEAKAAAMVSHPNVIGVYDAGEDGGQAFIVMELVTGETLSDRIERGPLELENARQVGVDVLDALAAAHARGVLHRDIRPANVLLTDGGDAK